MDPLSILASVAGLLMAAGTVTTTLMNMSSNIIDAPKLVAQVLSEVSDVKNALWAMQEFLLGLVSAPRRRRALIQLDQLIATLTEAILTFSELETMIAPFYGESSATIARRMVWHWKEDAASRIMERLNRHKSSLSLMLNILQCQSDLEAEQSRETLQSLVEQLLESNKEISRRLRNLEWSYDSQSILTRCFRNGVDTEAIEKEDNEDTKTITSLEQDSSKSNVEMFDSQMAAYRSTFETELETSRVYKRIQTYESGVSFTTSNVRTRAWSVFSGLSLAEISIISVIALPINFPDISNGLRHHFEESCQSVSQRAAPSYIEPSILPTIVSVRDQINTRDQIKKPSSTLVLEEGSRPVKIPAVDEIASEMKLYKLVVVGDDNVGKTALTIHFNHFVETRDPTMEDSYRKQVVIDNESCMLEVLDTAGQEEYRTLHEQWIRDGEGFVIVYSVTSYSSFRSSWKYHDQIKRVKQASRTITASGLKFAAKPEWIPIILVGNNCEQAMEREVSVKEGHRLAMELGCEFTEASTKDCLNVEKAFHDVVRRIRLHQRLSQQDRLRLVADQRSRDRQQRLNPTKKRNLF